MIYTLSFSIVMIIGGCGSTDDATKDLDDASVEATGEKEGKELETTEPTRFDDGDYPDDFPWPVQDGWEAKNFTTRIVEGEKNWNGKFYFEKDAEEMATEYQKVLEKAGFKVIVNDPEPVDAKASFSIVSQVAEQGHMGGMFFRTEDDGSNYVLAAVQGTN